MVYVSDTKIISPEKLKTVRVLLKKLRIIDKKLNRHPANEELKAEKQKALLDFSRMVG